MTAELQSYVITLRATANPQDCVMIGKAEVTCSPKLSSQRCQKEIYLSSSQKRERERAHTASLGEYFWWCLHNGSSSSGSGNGSMASGYFNEEGCWPWMLFSIWNYLGARSNISLHIKSTLIFAFNNLYFWEWTGNITIQFVICPATQKGVQKFTLAPLNRDRSCSNYSVWYVCFSISLVTFPPCLLPFCNFSATVFFIIISICS